MVARCPSVYILADAYFNDLSVTAYPTRDILAYPVATGPHQRRCLLGSIPHWARVESAGRAFKACQCVSSG